MLSWDDYNEDAPAAVKAAAAEQLQTEPLSVDQVQIEQVQSEPVIETVAEAAIEVPEPVTPTAPQVQPQRRAAAAEKKAWLVARQLGVRWLVCELEELPQRRLLTKWQLID